MWPFSKMELKKELGGNAEEHLDSSSTFLHSKATTLELSMGESFLSSLMPRQSVKRLSWHQKGLSVFSDVTNVSVRRVQGVDMVPEKWMEFIKNSLRCYICLGSCQFCSVINHHWILCFKTADNCKTTDSQAKYQIMSTTLNLLKWMQETMLLSY